MKTFKCTAVDCRNSMFHVGGTYQVVEGNSGVRDDLGRIRYLGEGDFIIRNTCLLPGVGVVYKARFERINL